MYFLMFFTLIKDILICYYCKSTYKNLFFFLLILYRLIIIFVEIFAAILFERDVPTMPESNSKSKVNLLKYNFEELYLSISD